MSRRLEYDELERLLAEVQQERRVRLDILRMDDMAPRGFKRRPRPKTALIAQAAQVAVDVSEWLKGVDTETITETSGERLL